MTRLFKNILNWNLWSNIILILMWLAVEERISFSPKSCNNVMKKNCFNEEDYTNNHKQPNRHHNLLKLIVKVTSTSLYRWDCRQNRLMIIPKRHFQHIHLICYYTFIDITAQLPHTWDILRFTTFMSSSHFSL